MSKVGLLMATQNPSRKLRRCDDKTKTGKKKIQWVKLRFSLPSDNSVRLDSPVGLSVSGRIFPGICFIHLSLIQSLSHLLSTYYMAGMFLGTGAGTGESADTQRWKPASAGNPGAF